MEPQRVEGDKMGSSFVRIPALPLGPPGHISVMGNLFKKCTSL